ncbi:hypothetical protein GCM10010191_31580 [Actinomadura vinacea]|uniref:Protein kinase domain-containing protein n=1 Tax=Actinomadura vinacea TaxID=115336 RepID=A0ABN3J1S8_9ACTN
MGRETNTAGIRHLGQYRLLDRVGGGVGVVHRAADASGRDVAIRVLPPGEYDLARMKEVRSPYVVDVLDGDGDGAPPYIVSRFVPGRPLGEWLTAPLQGAELRRLALGLAKAIAALHRTGLTHGDLRPDHILVVDGAPVVIDFGLVPGGPAADLRAWTCNVAFAATADPECFGEDYPAAARGEAIPEPLRLLLRAAWTCSITPEGLAEALAAVELTSLEEPEPHLTPAPPDRAAASAAPRSEHAPAEEARLTPAASRPVQAPGEEERSAVSPPASEASRLAAPDRRAAHEMAVARAWARLLTVMVMVIAVGIAIALPLAGIFLSLVAVTVLRAGADGAARALVRTALSVPYAAAAAVLVTLGLAGMSAVKVEVDPLGACAFGAGAAVGVLWAGPGVRGPRRGLEAAFASVVRAPRRIALAGIVLGVLALCAVVAAISLTPSLAPLYGLQSGLENAVGRFQSALL